MNYSLSSETFFVTENHTPKLHENGPFAVYVLTKKNIGHDLMMRLLPSGTKVCGVKDKGATTTQWVSWASNKEVNFEELEKQGIYLELRGYSETPLKVGIHSGNSFKVLVNANESEIKTLKKIKKDFLIGNYFGEQRFDERVAEFSNFVEKKDFENAFKNIVCASSIRDSEKSKQIKEIISKNWGNWKKIIENELIAGTKKELPFKHLLEKKIIENSNKNQNENKKDEDYFGAILCCEPKALKWLLKGCQALRFNQVLAKEALTKKPNNKFITIAGLKLGVFANNAFKREISIEANELEKAFGLNGLSRKTFFTPKRVSVKKIKEKNKKENEKENENKKAKQDTLNITPENTKLVNTEISFDLGTGNYATIVLDAMKAFLE